MGQKGKAKLVKLVRLSGETHQKLTEMGRKTETYDDIIRRVLQESLELSRFKENQLKLCDKLLEVMRQQEQSPTAPQVGYPWRRLIQDVQEKVLEMKAQLLSKEG